MHRTLFVLFCCLLAPSAGHAGAWMREKGKTFVAAQSTVRMTGLIFSTETDIYIDHGVTERLSAGFALFDDGRNSGHMLVFLRHPLRSGRGGAQMAVEYGLGVQYTPVLRQSMYRLTFAYGRGFNWGRGYGWVNIDTTVEMRAAGNAPTYKADATLGQSSGRKVRPMFKLGLEQAQNAPLTWAASAHVMIDGPRDITWLVGVERKRSGGGSTAVSLGLWRKF